MRDRKFFKRAGIATIVIFGLEILLWYSLRLAAPTGDIFIYAGMISLLLFLLLQIISFLSDWFENIVDKIIGFVGIPAVIAIIICVVNLLVWLFSGYTPDVREQRSKMQWEFHQTLISEVKALVNASRYKEYPLLPTEIYKKIHKIFYIPEKEEDLSNFIDLIPPFEEATFEDSVFTVFFVYTSILETIGHYERTPTAAYKVRYDFYFIEWPKKVIIAKNSIISEPPPSYTSNATIKGVFGTYSDVDDWLKAILGHFKFEPD